MADGIRAEIAGEGVGGKGKKKKKKKVKKVNGTESKPIEDVKLEEQKDILEKQLADDDDEFEFTMIGAKP